MATYLNPHSDVVPCMGCGHDISGLLFKSMTSDVACSCGAPLVIGCALFGDANRGNMGSRFQLEEAA
jgi:hypothetical protein